MAKRIREKNRNMPLLTFRRWHCAKIQPHNGKSITNFLHASAVQPAQNIYNSSEIVINLQAAQVRRHFHPSFVQWEQKKKTKVKVLPWAIWVSSWSQLVLSTWWHFRPENCYVSSVTQCGLETVRDKKLLTSISLAFRSSSLKSEYFWESQSPTWAYFLKICLQFISASTMVLMSTSKWRKWYLRINLSFILL